jgi:hypothetical protein
LEVFVRRLRIRIVRQGVTYVFSVGLGGHLIACVSSLVLPVTLYVSFCMYHLPKRHMMWVLL